MNSDSLSLSCTYLSLKFLVPPFDRLMTIITGCLECILLDLKQKEKWLKKPKQRKLQDCKLYEARNFDCIWVWFRINIITCMFIVIGLILSSFRQPSKKKIDLIFIWKKWKYHIHAWVRVFHQILTKSCYRFIFIM